MSAASAISSLYSTLKSNASEFKNTANGLVTDAQNIVSSLGAYQSAAITYVDPARTAPSSDVAPQPPTLETANYQIPALPPLEEIDTLNDKLTAKKPTITLVGKVFDPNVIQTEYANEQFTGDLTLKTKPDFSLIGAEPTAPTLTIPQSFSVDPLSGDPNEAPKPEFATFNEQLIPYYLDGLALSATEIAQLHEWFAAYAAQFATTDGVFFRRLRDILNQTQWAVPYERWHQLTYQQGAQAAQFQQFNALDEQDQAPASAAGLPIGPRSYSALRIATETARTQMETLAKADQGLREKEMEFFKFALTNAQQLTQLALSLKLQQIVWQQQAMKTVMMGVEATIDLAMAAIDLKEKEFAAVKRYNEFQINRAKAIIQREKSKLESLRIALESEKLKITYNENNIKAYQVAIDLIDSRIKKYQIEIDYTLVQQDVLLLKIENLTTEVQQYAANVRLFKLKQDLMNAKTKEDQAYLEAEIKQYESILLDVRKQALNLRVKTTNNRIKAAQLQQEATIYNASLSGYLKEFEAISKTSEIAAKAIAAGAKAERLQPQVAAMQQEVLDAKLLQEKIFEVKDKKFAEVIKLKQHELRVNEAKAKAQALAQAASVAGGIATQAFAGLNAVATDIFQETV